MAKLVFKGHETRGKELHKLLENLGGVDAGYSTCSCVTFFYYINREGYIEGSIFIPDYMNHRMIMSLETFESKYPYKVGDKVIDMNGLHGTITAMIWDECNCTVLYTFKDDEVGTNRHGYPAMMLKPYIVDTGCCSFLATQPSYTLSVESMKDMKRSIIFDSDAPNETELILGDNFEIQVKDGKSYVVRKKPKYPKTYVECCEVLGINELPYMVYTWNRHEDVEAVLLEPQFTLLQKLENLRRIITCRDAYWKIAGKWKPDYTNPYIDLYVIINVHNNIEKAKYGYGFQNCVLSFPTEEMRDAFYENFKELIEECKELL